MDTNRGGLGGFLRDTAKIIISGPEKRPEQQKPVRREPKSSWGNRAYIKRDQLERDLKKPTKFPDGKLIRLKKEKRSGLLDKIFPPEKKIITREEAIRNVRKFGKLEGRRRNTGIPVSERILSRQEVEFAQKYIMPGPKEIGPKTSELGIGRNIGNVFRVAAGKPIKTESSPKPDPFSVQQNNQPINQINENTQK